MATYKFSHGLIICTEGNRKTVAPIHTTLGQAMLEIALFLGDVYEWEVQ